MISNSNSNVAPFPELIKKLESQKAVLHNLRNIKNGPAFSKSSQGNETKTLNSILVELSTVTFATVPLESAVRKIILYLVCGDRS
jgi:hypothetical protein